MNAVKEAVPSIMLPWEEWKDPEMIQTETKAVKFDSDGKNLIMVIRDGEGSKSEYENIGDSAIKELAGRIGFPAEFVLNKLSPEIQPLVINDRLKTVPKQKFSFIQDEDGKIIASSPGWRENTSHREVAQIAYDALSNVDFIESVTVDEINRNNGTMSLRFMTPVEAAVTPKVGDILQLGLNLRHSLATELEVDLFTRRLFCTNGMSNSHHEYQWSSDAAKTKGRQIEWLKEAVHEAVDTYDLVIARAAQMANTVIEGDMTAALYQRARSLKIPRNLIPKILEAFNKEPGNTEWHIVNAITRFGTHNPDREMGSRMMREAGNMVENYTMVEARMPLYIAQTGGYEIVNMTDSLSG